MPKIRFELQIEVPSSKDVYFGRDDGEEPAPAQEVEEEEDYEKDFEEEEPVCPNCSLENYLPSANMWSFGILLYELLSGEPLPEIDSEDAYNAHLKKWDVESKEEMAENVKIEGINPSFQRLLDVMLYPMYNDNEEEATYKSCTDEEEESEIDANSNLPVLSRA